MKAVPLLLGFLLLAASEAQGGWFAGRDDCAAGTRHSRAEYQAEHGRARQLESLDCAGLTACAEAQRAALNAWTLGVYNRPLFAAPARAPAPAPAATPAPVEAPTPAEVLPEPPAPPPTAPPIFGPRRGR